MATLYWKQGKRTDPGSVSNVTSLLFMWCASGFGVVCRGLKL